MGLAPGQGTSGITGLTDGGLYEGTKVSTALELVLDPQTSVWAEFSRPLCVDFAFKIERATFISDITGSDEQGERNPEHECVDGEERTIVKEGAGPAHERCDDTERCCQGRYDKFWTVSNTNDVSVCPHVEPGKKTEYERSERVNGQL